MSKRSFGFIYILSNLEMDGVYKVGMTERSPHQRAAEISAATGVPQPFIVEYYAEVASPAFYEKMVHKKLADYRVSDSREFFRADIMTIVAAIRNADDFSDDAMLPWFEAKGQIVTIRDMHAAGQLPETTSAVLTQAIEGDNRGGVH